jgi:predicted CxxxxCH...CXXCH cytochrome family protein
MASRKITRAILGRATLLALAFGALLTGPAFAADMTTVQAGAHPSHTQNNGARVAIACAECHAPVCSPAGSKNIVFGALATSGGAAPTYNASTKTCSNVYCHGSNGKTVSWTYVDISVVKPLTTECAMCHGYPPAPGHPQTTACSGCHSTTVLASGAVDVTGGHHLNGSLDLGGGTGACNGCHGTSTTNGMPDYASSSTKANSHAEHSTFNCSACHAGTTADGTTILAGSTLHMNNVFNVVPGPTASFVYTFASPGGSCSNVSCHFGAGGTWGTKVNHQTATLGAAEVLVFSNANTDHGANFTISESCTTCHYESLTTQHAGRCDLCHQGSKPAENLGEAWKGGCSQGACHATVHAGMGDNHNGMWWDSSSSCALCHDTSGGDFPGPGDNCSRCHDPSYTAASVGDHQPPTTTSNALSSYTGTASIRLTATDAGTSGVSVTWSSLDGKGWNLGTDVFVGAPLSGAKAHTLAFYSADHAMNVEAVKSVAFTVQAVPQADAVPPVTTSSFTPAANANLKANQTVNLTATDAGSGVKTTYYRIDSGSFVAGTSFTVSGDGLHTFSYYSVDNANNTEATHVSNSFRIDTVVPVTTSTAAATTYTGSQTFSFAATDSGSGIASTWYRLDAGANTAGTTVTVAAPSSGSASHTLYWYSVDNAGNQEATKSVAFTIQAPPVADATAPTTTSSFSPAAGANFKANQSVTLTPTDNVGGSGVKATYYKVDAGAFVQGTSFTVSGDGPHTFSYYSVDNANNTETTHVSNSFRIDTVAPVTSSGIAAITYQGTQTVSFLATDSGSGVASTWYKLDAAGAFTSGTTVVIAAPTSGSASHTLSWYSLDNAGNQEVAKSVTFTLLPAPVVTGTTTLSFRTNASFGGWSYVTWEVHDANGNVVNDVDGNACTWWNDDPGHPVDMGKDYVVPAGVAYTMYGAWGPMPDGPDEDAATKAVTAGEAAPGATITWWWY